MGIRFFPAIALTMLLCSVPASAHYLEPDEEKAIPHAVAPAHQHDHGKKRDAMLPSADASVYTTKIFVQGDFRYVTSDGLPDEPHGQFPNAHNPNVIGEKHYSFRMPANPIGLEQSIPEMPHLFGVALDGIPFDPGTAEFWRHDPRSGWHGEAMGAPGKLGLDMNNAHVQPDGAYHYHGIPTSLVHRLSKTNGQTLVGYGADGFPIYVEAAKPSFRLKSGTRPGGDDGPGGFYDGKYTEDYEFVPGLGDLDECNGKIGVTTQFPKGTYYYVLTEAFPYVPRRWRGQPDPTFFKHGPPPGGHMGPPGRPPFGPPGF